MTDKYQKPSVTVDIVILTEIKEDYHVLLIKRKNDPYKDCWAIPGGYLDIPKEWGEGETLQEAAYRELQEETSLSKEDLSGVILRQFKTYGDPKRDPRDRIISVVFYAIIPYSVKLMESVKAQDDAKEAEWFPLRRFDPYWIGHSWCGPEPLKTAFDHNTILYDIFLGLVIGKI